MFKMKVLGKLKRFLVIDFEQTDGEVKMSQERYVRKLLEKFEMKFARLQRCHMSQNLTSQKVLKR